MSKGGWKTEKRHDPSSASKLMQMKFDMKGGVLESHLPHEYVYKQDKPN